MRSARACGRSGIEAAPLHRRHFTSTPDGTLPACSGNGFEHIEMQFLSDVYLRCGECDGRRYRPETLQIRSRAPTLDAPVLPRSWT